jgi:hypothetical protein
MPEHLLAEPVRSLLDRFSFGWVQSSVDWVAARLADGTLRSYHRCQWRLQN